MNFNEIEKLLEKFYDGMTTPEEESLLRKFFTLKPVPPQFASDADLFRFYEQSSKEELIDPEFEARFLSAIDKSPGKTAIRKKRFLYLSGFAAAILLLTALVFTFRQDVFRKSHSSTPEAMAAYRQARSALLLLSSNLNTGLANINRLDDFQRGLEQVQKLQTFQQGLEKINNLSTYYQHKSIDNNQGSKPHPQNH
jgi:hypothetical protein